eukprot:8936067-Heterocapsa_arctica.AAC.1
MTSNTKYTMTNYTSRRKRTEHKSLAQTFSGSQFDFEFMLEHCTDHVMLIQEHWRLKEELHTWQTLAHLKGWQGIWEPAKVTDKYQDGVTGRSGG